LRYDCIILGDVTPEELPPAERIRLEKYVGERGGTLVMLAGKRSMPMQFLVDPRPGMDLDPIQRLLPLTNVQPVSAPNGFPVTLTGEGRLMPFLRLEPSGDLSAERWAKLPDHYWGIVGKAKEGAVPLASFRPRDAKEGVSERENALFVRQNFGFGRVLFVGLDSTWRWRYKTGDLYHHRFWGQVIRWAATDRPLIAGNEHIRFGTREPGYRQDQDIEFLVRLGEKVRKPTGESLIGTRIIRLPTKEGEKEQVVGLVPLTPNEYRPRELTGVTRDLPPGNYAMELVLPDLVDQLTSLSGSDPTKQRANFKIYPPDNAELVDLSPNVSLLEEIAERSGGKVYYVDQLTQLVERIAAQSVTRDKQDVQKLWQSWWTLILFVLLITMEWGLRKWAGLP